MKSRILARLLLLSSVAFPTVTSFAETKDVNPEIKVEPVLEDQTANKDSKLSDQFSVICLVNNTDVGMNFRWWVTSSQDVYLPAGYQQTFSWNDTGAHSITVRYNADLSGGVAWKTYSLQAGAAPFPDCQYGRKYQFSKVGSRWVEIYQGITP